MKRPMRPRDPVQLAKLVVDMATGEVPNDKEQVLAAMADEQGELTGRAKSAKARAASQTLERRSEIARRAAIARWGVKVVAAYGGDERQSALSLPIHRLLRNNIHSRHLSIRQVRLVGHRYGCSLSHGSRYQLRIYRIGGGVCHAV